MNTYEKELVKVSLELEKANNQYFKTRKKELLKVISELAKRKIKLENKMK